MSSQNLLIYLQYVLNSSSENLAQAGFIRYHLSAHSHHYPPKLHKQTDSLSLLSQAGLSVVMLEVVSTLVKYRMRRVLAFPF